MTDKSFSILIVDDDTFLLDIYAVKFKELGHEVDTAQSGQEAIEKIKTGDYNVMLFDILMPSMSGLDLLTQLEEKNLAQGMQKIVLSNQGDKNDIEEAEKHDIAGYIIKANLIPSEVVDEVEKIAKSN